MDRTYKIHKQDKEGFALCSVAKNFGEDKILTDDWKAVTCFDCLHKRGVKK